MAVRTISARFAGTCGDCKHAIAAGDTILYGGRGKVAHANGTCTLDNCAAGMTTRERKAARAERLRGWAESRDAKAAALHRQNEPYRGDIAFNTQPGHIPERARAIARTERAWEHSEKAASMERRADNIDAAADRAIYRDDVDAIERLEERIAELEAERDRWTAYNAACRKAKGPTVEALALLTARERAEIAPSYVILRKFGQAPSYHTANLGGNIARNRKRLAQLQAEQAREAV